MKLIISTESNKKFSIAIADASQLIDYVFVNKPFKQSELALKTIDQLLKKNQITNDKLSKPNYKLQVTNYKLEEIIVISGPGDFSAVRIGISIANALAYAWNVPIKAVELEKEFRQEKAKLKAVLAQSLKSKFLKVAKPIYVSEPNIMIKM